MSYQPPVLERAELIRQSPVVRSRALNLRAALYLGGGFVAAVALSIMTGIAGVGQFVIFPWILWVVWIVVVARAWMLAQRRLTESLDRPPDPAGALSPDEQLETQMQTGVPVQTKHGNLERKEYRDYDVPVSGVGTLVAGAGVVTRIPSASGACSVRIQVYLNEDLITEDEGPWGAIVKIPVKRQGHWSIRVSCVGGKQLSYTLSYQLVPNDNKRKGRR